MRKEIWRILKDLENDKITTNEAYNSLCVLFGVIKSVCVCKNRQDQFKRDNVWICGDCEEEIKQTGL